MSSSPYSHAGDAPSTSDVKVGKKKINVKFPCILCKGDHYSHLCPCMDEASSLLEKIQRPTVYRNISPNPSLVDGMVNLVPSLVSLVDQVVNLVSSSVEPLTKVDDPVMSSINPTFHLKIETQVTDSVPSSVNPSPPLNSAKVVAPVTSSVNPTPPLTSVKVVSLVTSSVNPTPPLKSAKVVVMVPPSVDPTTPLRSAKVASLVRSSINPTPPLKISKVVDPVPPLVDPTLPLESKPDTSHVFLIDTESTVLGGIPPSPVKPPLSKEAILFYWGVLTRPHLLSHIPFKITI
jgi:hypothetical protein